MKSPLTHFLIAAVITGAALSGYAGWYATVSNESGRVADLQARITAATASVTRMASVHTAFAEIAGDEATIEGYFVPETGVVSFINGLETLGNAQHATVSVLSVSTGPAAGQPTLLITLSIKGTFDAVMRTVGAIEYVPYDVSFSTLSIAKDSDASWHADLNMTVGSIPKAAAPAAATTTPTP